MTHPAEASASAFKFGGGGLPCGEIEFVAQGNTENAKFCVV